MRPRVEEEAEKKYKPSAPSSGNSRKPQCTYKASNLTRLRSAEVAKHAKCKTLERKLTVKDVLSVT